MLGPLVPASAAAQPVKARYESALAREEKARRAVDNAADGTAAAKTQAQTEARSVIAAYHAIVRRFPTSGYSDNALFNAARLAETLHQRFGQARDRQTALDYYERVAAEYPSSPLIKQSEIALARLEPDVVPAVVRAVAETPQTRANNPAPSPGNRARLTAIERTVLPDTVRITLSLDQEVAYREETLAGPARVFFDFKGVDAAPDLIDAVLRFPADPVRQIRVGRHPDRTVRVVLDLEGVTRHDVYALYNPFRVVVDCATTNSTTAAASLAAPTAITAPRVITAPPVVAETARASSSPSSPPGVALAVIPEPLPPLAASATTPPSAASPAPEAPNANRAGGFSLSRQLGLGVSRIVIDAGHGGHDPGALGKGLTEAELTLDVALRLEKLLQAEPGLEVVLTRRSNVFIPLEERTAIANREGADLFLSIHANASRRAAAQGIETYFLSFAATAEAEAVAARENSASAGEMHNLPDIIKAIALNNKLDESRDFAGMVQEAMVTRLRRSNRDVRNLGVKKAPFVVLIGAQMPSVLAEVSFLTNKQDLQLLKTSGYKQRIAEALHAAVMRYRRSLKGQAAVAER